MPFIFNTYLALSLLLKCDMLGTIKHVVFVTNNSYFLLLLSLLILLQHISYSVSER